MPVHILRSLKKRAGDMACNSVFYQWSLRGDVPDRLIVRPVDPWPGVAAYGAMILDGQMPGIYRQADLHSFCFLRDLRRFSRQSGVRSAQVEAQARVMVKSWIKQHGQWEAQSWSPCVAGQRIAMWISHYEFFAPDAYVHSMEGDAFEDVFLESLARQARHVSRHISACQSLAVFEAAQGLLYAGLAFEGHEHWVAQALDHIVRALHMQLTADGMHKSRSPAQLARILRIVLDVRSALSAAGHPLPEKIQHSIDRMGQALRFFRYNDKKLAVFHGCQEEGADALRPDIVDMLLSQSGVRGKVLKALPGAGYERLTLGRTSLMVDCGCVQDLEYDRYAHASPLAFEMSYGATRVFVNCGTHPVSADWQEALRATAAHNALVLSNRNACEIRTEGRYAGHFSRRAHKVTSYREDSKSCQLLDAAHSGYERLNGFTHRRRLYMCEQGHDIRGEEALNSPVKPSQPLDWALRFHLHPKVMVSLIRDGQEALIRLPGGVGWRFSFSGEASGAVLALEDSVYLGEGCEPRKTKQLAIYGQIFDKKLKIKWSMRKEG